MISVSDSAGAGLGLNSYDEYGEPGASNLGRYQYTGQKWIGEAGLYDYKARDYVPQLGIFAQTDPIGYDDSPNLYAYVLDDPVNLVDPFGLASEQAEIFITAYPLIFSAYGSYLISGLFAGAVMRGEFDPPDPNEIVITAKKPKSPVLRRLAQCTLNQYGLTGLGTAFGLIGAGQPIPAFKPYVTPGTSSGSSIARRVLGGIRPDAGPFRVPTGDFVGGRITGRALGWTVTKGAGKAAARWIPFVGWGLLAADVGAISICTVVSE